MRPTDNIEKQINKFNINVNHDKDRQVLDEILQAQANKSRSRRVDLWRIIMNSKITKYATAAMVLIALGLSMTLITPAYAIEQTIEAYNSIRWLRVTQSNPVGRETWTTEIWFGFDQQGNVIRQRVQADKIGTSIGGIIMVGDSDSHEAFLPQYNLHLTGYGEKSDIFGFDVSDLEPKRLIEKLLVQQERDEVILDIDESFWNGKPIKITVTYPNWSPSEKWKKVFYIDQATKLVQKIEKFEMIDDKFQLKNTRKFYDCNIPIDLKMFSIDDDIPADARVIDMSEVEVGMPQGDLTDKEIAAEVITQFFEAVIDNDFDRAGQLFLGVPGFLIGGQFTGVAMIKIITIGQAVPDPDPDSNAMICQANVLVQAGDQYYDVNSDWIKVTGGGDDNKPWRIIGNSSMSKQILAGPLTVSTDGAELSAVTYHGLEPGEFMKDWLVLGPLPYQLPHGTNPFSKQGQQVAFDTDYLDVLNFTPKPTINNVDHQWSILKSTTDAVELRLLDITNDDFNVAYMWAQIDMTEETQGVLGVGSDDGIKVWLNGELVHAKWMYREVAPDDDRVPVTFKKGSNQLVIKVQNALGPWGFCCRLIDE